MVLTLLPLKVPLGIQNINLTNTDHISCLPPSWRRPSDYVDRVMAKNLLCVNSRFYRFYFDKHDTIRYSINITWKEFVSLLKHGINWEFAVILRTRATSRAWETAITVTRVCSRMLLLWPALIGYTASSQILIDLLKSNTALCALQTVHPCN